MRLPSVTVGAQAFLGAPERACKLCGFFLDKGANGKK
jgi:hypothetical protein